MNNYSYERTFTRGEIYYIYKSASCGSEQMAGRPAIIVSNDMCNEYSSVLEVVFLTTQPKSDMPTHVSIRSSQKPSTALCEQINTVDISRIGDYVGSCTQQEMDAIDTAMMISLGIEISGKEPKIIEKEVIKEVPVEVIKEVPAQDSDELIEARAQLDQLNAMYNSLLEKFIGR